MFVRLISHQPAVLFSQNKPATSNQPVVLFLHTKSAPAINHQPNEQAAYVVDNTALLQYLIYDKSYIEINKMLFEELIIY
jgi:hypothetical protein